MSLQEVKSGPFKINTFQLASSDGYSYIRHRVIHSEMPFAENFFAEFAIKQDAEDYCKFLNESYADKSKEWIRSITCQ